MENIQAAADSIATATSHPVTVQLITQGAGIWGNVATGLTTGLLTGGITLAGIWLTHRFTLHREKRASEDKVKRERLFIATELIFLLEEFAEKCALVAADNGERDQFGITVVTEDPPLLDLTSVTGDWRVLPPKLMYRIRELPIRLTEAGKYVASANENDFPEDYSRTFWERQYQYSRLGLKALFSAIRLRQIAEFPPTRLNATSWSVQPMLMELWRQERRRRAVLARLRLQSPLQLHVALQQSIKNKNLSGGSK